jgi:predicted Holliday junction resolvase-like endonuclease
MRSPLLDYFAVQRSLFGLCPHCADIFRLSDTRVFLRAKPKPDWMDALAKKGDLLEAAEEKLAEKEEDLRSKAREAGRREAMKHVARVDRVFTPRRLNPDDAKVIFHPIDYVVFDGMKIGPSMRRVLLLDRETTDSEHRALQRSIATAVEKGRMDWKTLTVRPDGSIVEK